jgi:MoxR-like ATPase
MSNLEISVITALRRFSNVVLEGPPGTGKTFVVSQIADAWQQVAQRPLTGAGVGEYAITLHPSTSYEDMVEGMRYDEKSQSFRTHPGFMRRVIAQAEAAPDQDFLVLLDEINRANIPKVLGDMLMTMEHSKRAKWDPDKKRWMGAFSTTLPYSGEIFAIPDNVYLLGTMNTSDRSIAPLDSALRRRFAFVRVQPLGGEELADAIDEVRGGEARTLLEESVEQLTAVNSVLRRALGPDAMLGHSYLFDPEPEDVMPGLNAALKGATSAVWLEVRKGQGANGSQIDLSGSENLFYPLTTPTGVKQAKDRQRVDSFSVSYQGTQYDGIRLKYQPSAPVWRLFLDGTAQHGGTLSTRAKDGVPLPGYPDARRFEHRVLVWVDRGSGVLELRTYPATAAVKSRLRGLSPETGRTAPGPSGRDFGRIDVAAAGSTSDEPWLTWRYSILPQLVENLLAAGAEELLDPWTRAQWLAANGVDPLTTEPLASFDAFLDGLGIILRIAGRGLSRTMLILDSATGDVETDDASGKVADADDEDEAEDETPAATGD